MSSNVAFTSEKPFNDHTRWLEKKLTLKKLGAFSYALCAIFTVCLTLSKSLSKFN